MRLRNITGSRELIKEEDFIVSDPEELKSLKGRWRERFGNDHPIHIEVGMGKGRFIMELARRNPDINYIGIEKYSSILVRASRKMRDFEGNNVLFVRMDAEDITDVFAKDEVDQIYLNFSDPWPKDRHAKRRLPSKEFLRRFGQILKKDGTIEFKTDNRALFDFAVDEVEAGGFKILQITYDLHSDPVMNEGNIMTEYEERFSAKGNPICKYILGRKE